VLERVIRFIIALTCALFLLQWAASLLMRGVGLALHTVGLIGNALGGAVLLLLAVGLLVRATQTLQRQWQLGAPPQRARISVRQRGREPEPTSGAPPPPPFDPDDPHLGGEP
jgi:hypothetical protein